MSSAESPPRAASLADVTSLCAALAMAFETDPVFCWLLPDRRSRQRRLDRFFELELRHIVLPHGRAVVCDRSAGACLELPPGKWRMSVGAQLAHGLAFTRVFGARLPLALALITKMEARHLQEPHYYIPYVGTVPDAQGQGLGSALLSATLERCDREHLPAYLEATSRRNAALYARLGFQELGELSVGGSPPVWPMRQPV